MPPFLAFFFCTVFVAFLLRYDAKLSKKVSPTVWVPTLWMFSIATKPMATWFNYSGGGDDLSGSPLDRIFQLSLLGLALSILAQRKFYWAKTIKSNRWLFLLIGYMLISILWSDIPYTSFKRWVRELVAVVMALVIVTEKDPQYAVQTILRRCVYILIPYSIMLIKYFPELGVGYSWAGERTWTGVTMQKNGLGRLCIIAVFFLLWTFFRRWQKREVAISKYQTYAEVLLLLMTLFLLKGPSMYAASATGLASLVVGLSAFGGLVWMRKNWQSGIKIWKPILACIFIVGSMQPLVGGATVGGLTAALGRDSTLTGRTEIWAGLMPDLQRHPVLGYGFGAFWTPERSETHDRAKEAHNGYLDVWLGLGVIGLLLTAKFLLTCCGTAIRSLSQNYDWASLTICYLLMAVVHNISESSINVFSNQLTATCLFVAISFGSTRQATGGAPLGSSQGVDK